VDQQPRFGHFVLTSGRAVLQIPWSRLGGKKPFGVLDLVARARRAGGLIGKSFGRCQHGPAGHMRWIREIAEADYGEDEHRGKKSPAG